MEPRKSTAGSVAGHDLSSTCEDDRCTTSESPVYHCVDCDSSYCRECWPLQRPHKPKKRKSQHGTNHEQGDVQVIQRFASILNPTRDPESILALHQADRVTKLLSVVQHPQKGFVFQDHGRLESLLLQLSADPKDADGRPQLVSFMGITNTGKSTLIKMLVQQGLDASDMPDYSAFPSPVIGSIAQDSTPCSGDVHLFADPRTSKTSTPLLYIDCESTDDGESIPLGAQSRVTALDNDFKTTNIVSRPVQWSSLKESRRRHQIIQLLYPRLLYNFSDCAVFVSRNPRSFQSATLATILQWGAMSLERSLNQPALPHCVVVFNGVDPTSEDQAWDITFATNKLLEDIEDTLYSSLDVRVLAEHWRMLGKKIDKIKDLILCFYASFHVVRIPGKPRYMVMDAQVRKLHNLIKANCEESAKIKQEARLPVMAKDLGALLHSAFDHFSAHLNMPFNATTVSDVGGRMVHLCALAASVQPPTSLKACLTILFDRLSMLLASCVLWQAIRDGKDTLRDLVEAYTKRLDAAMDEYTALDSPCAYASADGTRRCKLVRARHGVNGHQDERGIIGGGQYEPSPTASILRSLWKAPSKRTMESVHRQMRAYSSEAGKDSAGVAAQIHWGHLQRFLEGIGPLATQQATSICFCYLMPTPFSQNQPPLQTTSLTAASSAPTSPSTESSEFSVPMITRRKSSFEPANLSLTAITVGVRNDRSRLDGVLEASESGSHHHIRLNANPYAIPQKSRIATTNFKDHINQVHQAPSDSPLSTPTRTTIEEESEEESPPRPIPDGLRSHPVTFSPPRERTEMGARSPTTSNLQRSRSSRSWKEETRAKHWSWDTSDDAKKIDAAARPGSSSSANSATTSSSALTHNTVVKAFWRHVSRQDLMPPPPVLTVIPPTQEPIKPDQSTELANVMLSPIHHDPKRASDSPSLVSSFSQDIPLGSRSPVSPVSPTHALNLQMVVDKAGPVNLDDYDEVDFEPPAPVFGTEVGSDGASSYDASLHSAKGIQLSRTMTARRIKLQRSFSRFAR